MKARDIKCERKKRKEEKGKQTRNGADYVSFYTPRLIYLKSLSL